MLHKIGATHKPRKGRSSRPRCTLPHICPSNYSRHRTHMEARINQSRAINSPAPCLAPLKSRQIERKQPQQPEPCPQGLNPSRYGSGYHVTQLAPFTVFIDRSRCQDAQEGRRTGNALHCVCYPSDTLKRCRRAAQAPSSRPSYSNMETHRKAATRPRWPL